MPPFTVISFKFAAFSNVCTTLKVSSGMLLHLNCIDPRYSNYSDIGRSLTPTITVPTSLDLFIENSQ